MIKATTAPLQKEHAHDIQFRFRYSRVSHECTYSRQNAATPGLRWFASPLDLRRHLGTILDAVILGALLPNKYRLI